MISYYAATSGLCVTYCALNALFDYQVHIISTTDACPSCLGSVHNLSVPPSKIFKDPFFLKFFKGPTFSGSKFLGTPLLKKNNVSAYLFLIPGHLHNFFRRPPFFS